MDLQTEPRHRDNDPVVTLWGRRPGDHERDVLALNVLLLGDKQSGRSSVGNALIGGEEFQTGASMTTAFQLLSRNFQSYFRRQGAESDLLLRVVDTPPSLPRPQSVHELCPGGVHVIVLVVRADRLHADTHLEEQVEHLFGPEWRRHALLVITHADHLKGAGLQPAVFLTQASDWLRALAEALEGGVLFLDNSRDWPSVRGRPLRDQLLRLSARNHHGALAVRTEAR